jgi:hypothetical protein
LPLCTPTSAIDGLPTTIFEAGRSSRNNEVVDENGDVLARRKCRSAHAYGEQGCDEKSACRTRGAILGAQATGSSTNATAVHGRDKGEDLANV